MIFPVRSSHFIPPVARVIRVGDRIQQRPSVDKPRIRTVDLVLNLLRDDTPMYRKQAIRAIRWFDPDASSILCKILSDLEKNTLTNQQIFARYSSKKI